MNKTIGADYKEVAEELLQNTDVRREYEAMRPEYELIKQIIRARQAQGLTQAELAERIGTKQSNISRLEGGGYNPSLGFLQRVAEGLGKELHINIQ